MCNLIGSQPLVKRLSDPIPSCLFIYFIQFSIISSSQIIFSLSNSRFKVPLLRLCHTKTLVLHHVLLTSTLVSGYLWIFSTWSGFSLILTAVMHTQREKYLVLLMAENSAADKSSMAQRNMSSFRSCVKPAHMLCLPLPEYLSWKQTALLFV